MFAIGLSIRVMLIYYIAPLAIVEWYAPFLEISKSVFNIDPWTLWVNGGGDLQAFPYGYAMWIAFMPIILIAEIIQFPSIYAYHLTILIIDLCLLITLNKLIPNRHQSLLLAYWLSPIIILSSYILGLNDLIPALFIVISIYFMKIIRLKPAGIFLAIAISAKLSMLVALPFFIIYLFNNRALRQYIQHFILWFSVTTIFLWFPFLYSEAGLEMLIGNAKMGDVYQLAIKLGESISIFVVPLIYLLMLYLVWRARRINFDLFQAIIGMAFLLIVLLTPSSPGWFVWSIPFLAIYQVMSGRVAYLLVGVFSITYALSALLETSIHFSNSQKLDLITLLKASQTFGENASSILHTAMVALGLILVLRVWRQAISGNDFFRLSRKPFVIGVSGDSGAGKDTFSDAVSGLFGQHSVVKLSGDDYHLWDRKKPMWDVMTHLNPMANDLERYCKHLVSLIDGKSVVSKHYDHTSGQMSKPLQIKSNDFIIASGLHALYLPLLRECYNLKIFLEMDEKLRRHFKIERDVLQRGHSEKEVINSLKRRQQDSENFIHQQASYADLIFSLKPIHSKMLDSLEEKQPLRLKLIVTIRNGFNELSIRRALVAICGLHVDVIVRNEDNEVQMTIEGDVSAEDIALVSEMVCSDVLQFLDIPPKWEDGMLGVMQLITLSNISQELTKRFI